MLFEKVQQQVAQIMWEGEAVRVRLDGEEKWDLRWPIYKGYLVGQIMGDKAKYMGQELRV